jgi:biotin transport system substrate-specific component
MSIKQMSRISVFTALIIVFTIVIPPITVPVISVNFTLQTLVMMLAGLLLMPIEALLSMLIYLIIGSLGFPVFSGYTGGWGVLFGPTGGFLISFPLVAYLISHLTRKRQNLLVLFGITTIFGVFVVYSIGCLWLTVYLKDVKFYQIMLSMLVFIPIDLFKVGLACFISQKLKQRLV